MLTIHLIFSYFFKVINIHIISNNNKNKVQIIYKKYFSIENGYLCTW